MKDSPFYKLTGDHNCEINGLKMSQNIIAPAAWCLAIMQEKPGIVLEIGTGRGGLSYLMSQAVATYGGQVGTFDIKDELQRELVWPSEFGVGDVFAPASLKLIEHLFSLNVKMFVLCDGGNKEKEWNTFAPFLKPGDVIAAHDWINDRIPNFCPDYWSWSEVSEFGLNLSGMDEFMPEWFDKSAWFVRQKV